MRSRIILGIGMVAIIIAVSGLFHARATSPPNIAMPDLSGHCLDNGVTFTTVLTASNLTNTQDWQVNMTFTPGMVATMSYTFGSSFTGPNTLTSKNNSTSAGYFLLGIAFYNGTGPFSTASPVTLATFTWKTLVVHPTVTFHLVTLSENALLGTELLDPNRNSLPYTTTDGFLGCQLGPS